MQGQWATCVSQTAGVRTTAAAGTHLDAAVCHGRAVIHEGVHANGRDGQHSRNIQPGGATLCTLLAAAGVQLQPVPAQVQQFIACMVVANYKLSTIAGTMSALRRWAADDCGCPGVLDEPGVQRALKVAAKWAVQGKRQKLPLSAVQLKAIVRMLRTQQPGGNYVAARDEALFSVAWAGMLRSSEVVGLEWRDVHFTSAGNLMLYLPKTKTDPGAGSWVLLAAGAGDGARPAAAMRHLQTLSGGAAASGPVFKPSASSYQAMQKDGGNEIEKGTGTHWGGQPRTVGSTLAAQGRGNPRR